MKFLSALGLTAGIAAGYLAARELLDGERLASRVPEQAWPAVEAARERLRLARRRADTILDEVERERDRAEEELMRDYHERVGRPVAPPGASSAPPAPAPSGSRRGT
ncbi:MAG: hypothetical protein FJZ92_09355 [Chloroflexi bacterium]|nr:hypothetical protein [Chloroflexota bacterium]